MKRTFRNAATVAGLIEQQPARPAQDRPPGHLLLRHPLRHAAQVRPRPPAAAHHPRRGRPRPRRLRPHRGDARPQPRPHRRRPRPARHPPRRAALPRDGPRADPGGKAEARLAERAASSPKRASRRPDRRPNPASARDEGSGPTAAAEKRPLGGGRPLPGLGARAGRWSRALRSPCRRPAPPASPGDDDAGHRPRRRAPRRPPPARSGGRTSGCSASPTCTSASPSASPAAAAPLLPPYETAETLDRLAAEIAALAPASVVCLGDSFDDCAAGAGARPRRRRRASLALIAGRDWIWIAGNHDPAPLALPGRHLAELRAGPLTFRHAALPDAAPGEVSGHYHPKLRLPVRGGAVTRPCFLADATRLILPAFGAYTGGLFAVRPGARRASSPPTPAPS